jgi:hypothetical protein
VTPSSRSGTGGPADRARRDERSTIGVAAGLRGILVIVIASAALAGLAWLLALGVALMFPSTP